MPRLPKGTKPCRLGVRHWFTYYNTVGSSSPVCRRCGEKNPRYDKDADPYYFEHNRVIDTMTDADIESVFISRRF